MARRVRLVSWSVILALAIFQAWAQRYAVGPDGISYLDLSDAVVTGRWAGLLNAYWSPLYPALIGVARLVGGAGPEHEVPIVHAVNFAAFLAMFAAFEYMLISILSLAVRTRHSVLAGPWGLAGIYALFAVFAITMLPLELTTPDVLCATAVFLAMGAMLRLRDAATRVLHGAAVVHGHQRARPSGRDAVIFGIALGLGALAKSFLVPWSLVCFATLAVAVRGRGARGLRTLAIAGAAWAIIVVPWTAALSHASGRLTFGDAGRLTYAWYVNEQNPPSLGGVPVGARTARIDAILPGAGATGAATGTDPMWFDPARWNAGVQPHWSLPQQSATLATFVVFYIQNLTPLLFLIVLIVTAPAGTRRDAWRNGWVVYIPAMAGVAAYAAVIVTARYIMPFVLGATLVLLATLPLARRMLPALVLVGIAIPIGIEALTTRTVLGLALVASIVGGVAAGVLVPWRHKILWGIAVVAGLGVTRAVLTPISGPLLRIGVLALAVIIFIAARAAIRDRRPIRFARRTEAALALTLGLVLGLRLWLRVDQDAGELVVSNDPRWGNVSVGIAQDLASRGVGPGTRVAVIGPHAEAYWARAARVQIVANVPRPLAPEFWKLPAEGRDSLLADFARAGATVAIATTGPEGGVPDSTWTPVRYQGWIRRLSP